ncbi:hypothetical protein J6590_080158 [Homalodisca vitripennis]|nr:hypothetical protein J6590_080158 [Homalodisca vitripennis]
MGHHTTQFLEKHQGKKYIPSSQINRLDTLKNQPSFDMFHASYGLMFCNREDIDPLISFSPPMGVEE